MIAVDTEDDTIGIHEVVDGSTLFEELRVATHVERVLGRLADAVRDLGGGADGDRRLGYDDHLPFHAAPDRIGDIQHVPQIR